MYSIQRSAILPYSNEQMYHLVSDIESYSEFLPWCNDSSVQSKQTIDDKTIVIATIGINFSALKQSFSTKNVNYKDNKIEMSLVNGPFSHLQGLWTFSSLDESACKIELQMEFDFSSKLMAKMIAPIFEKICENFIDAFSNRAEEVYGKVNL